MTSVVSERDVYRTSDLALAAVLALAYPLEALDRSQTCGVAFVFRRDDALDDLVAQYWRGELRVEPRAYGQHVQLLQAQEYAITAPV